jgi:transposase-like protein
MLICKDCGITFEEPVTCREYHGLDYGYETMEGCPFCGSANFVEAKKCSVCGEPIAEGKICSDCLSEFKTAVDGFVEIYSKALGLRRDDVADLIIDCVG